MTVLLAVHDPDKRVTWCASDDRTVTGGMPIGIGSKWLTADSGWALGLCGSSRSMQVARRSGVLSDLPDDDVPYAIADRLRKAVLDDGWKPDDSGDGKAPAVHVWSVLASPWGVWMVGCDFCVVPIQAGQAYATGSGGELALGYYEGHRAAGKSVKASITGAIAAACRHDVGCGLPAHVFTLSVDG